MFLRQSRLKHSGAGELKNFTPPLDLRRKVLTLQAARQAQAGYTNQGQQALPAERQLPEHCPVSQVSHCRFKALERDRQLPVLKQRQKHHKDYAGNVSEVQLR